MRTSMDMLNGSLWDKIFKFSMPVAATAILEQFFTATDVVIAGNFANSDRTAAMAACRRNRFADYRYDYFSVLGPGLGL